MNKTIQILLVISGVGLVLWLVSRSGGRGQTVVVPQPVAMSTGSMGLVDQFFNAFNRIPNQSVGGTGATAAAWKAAPSIIKELPAVFKGIGGLFDGWGTPKTTSPAVTTSDASFDSSYEDYYATNGYR
jgi:hypothetical protein